MSTRFRCAVASTALGEPMFATASTVRRWLLIEQPGPWGRNAVLDNRMPPTVGRALAELGRRVPARVLMIRRLAGGSDVRTTVYVAVTGVRVRWLESFEFDDPADVLDLDFDGLADGSGVGGLVETDPLLLVCTNGRHDPCCAEFGRPVAAALHTAFGDRVWEVSHIGGDRFAGNLLVLPFGVYAGGLGPTNAVTAAKSYVRGCVDLGTYRGRSAYPFVVQAAEFFVRRDLGIDELDAVRWTSRQRLDPDRWRITFDVRGAGVEVDVAVGSGEIRQLTCHATREIDPPVFDLLDMREVALDGRT